MGAEMAKGYNFLTYINNKKIAFKKITELEYTAELESFSEGGNNGRVYSQSTSLSAERQMTFERGIPYKKDAYIPFTEGQRIEGDIEIYIMNDAQTRILAYYLSDCTVKNIRFGGLDAQQSEVLIERLEIVYERGSTEYISQT